MKFKLLITPKFNMVDCVNLVKFNKHHLTFTWKWLNDPQIKNLIDSPTITKKEQLIWYNSLSKKNNYLIWAIEYKELPIGACGLKNITLNSSEYWGYIGEKQYWGLGIGNYILDQMIIKATSLNNKHLWLKVLKNNHRAIKLYEKKKFKVIDELANGHIKMILKL